eukprot:jgi/Bigna1/141581/aug1.63_g16289
MDALGLGAYGSDSEEEQDDTTKLDAQPNVAETVASARPLPNPAAQTKKSPAGAKASIVVETADEEEELADSSYGPMAPPPAGKRDKTGNDACLLRTQSFPFDLPASVGSKEDAKKGTAAGTLPSEGEGKSDETKGESKKKKKKKKKKKRKKKLVSINVAPIKSKIKLPDFLAVASAVKNSRVDEDFENSIAEMAENLTNDKMMKLKKQQPIKAMSHKEKAALRQSGLVPRQVGRKRANISIEDVEAWTTVKRIKAQKVAEAKKKTTTTKNVI